MIEAIINKINDNIRKRSTELCDIKTPALFGLAEPVLIKSDDEDNNAAYPAIIDNEGECNYVFADDDYSFGVYHRLLSRNYQTNTKSWGDTNRDICLDEILLICWGFRNNLRMNQYDFERQIIDYSMSGEVVLVQTNFDKTVVFNNEFKNVAYSLPPELFLFSLRYKVRYDFNRKCVEINEENKC
jgi:hypothetical protein